MREAVAYKGMNGGHGGPFGAVIVKDGKVVGSGHNRVISSGDPTAHAEVTAIRDAAKNLGTHHLSGTVIYVNGLPCSMCMAAIFWTRIGRGHVPTVTGSTAVSRSVALWDAIDGHMGTRVGGNKPH